MSRYVDFKKVKEDHPILDVAEMLGLQLRPEDGGEQYRGNCPVCEGKRTFTITPGKEMCSCFRCRDEPDGIADGTDSIGLVKLVKDFKKMNEAAYFILERLGRGTVSTVDTVTVRKNRATPEEPRPRARDMREAPPASFDPEKFAAKLVWHEEVEKLGLTEDEAHRLGVGFHPQRKAVFFPVRNPSGGISGFIGCDAKHNLKLPPQWLDDKANVVRLKRA